MDATRDLFRTLGEAFNPNKTMKQPGIWVDLLDLVKQNRAAIERTLEQAENELFTIDTFDYLNNHLGSCEVDMEIRVKGYGPELIRESTYDSPAEYTDFEVCECIIETVNVWKDGDAVNVIELSRAEAESYLEKLL